MKKLFLLVLLHVIGNQITSAWFWHNDYDGRVNFQCGTRGYISYIRSQHNNRKEDRVWQYRCRDVPAGVSLTNCRWYFNVNSWDRLLAFRCSGNQVITGTTSYHDNRKEDRLFSFRCCGLVGRTQANCQMTGFLNTYDSPMSYTVPNGYALVGFASQHNDHHEDREWKAEICRMG